MENAEGLSLSEFLRCAHGIEFTGQNRAETYACVQRVLVAREYGSQSKAVCGVVRGYISQVTGLSLAQAPRLNRMCRETGTVQLMPYQRHQFPQEYTAADVALLVAVDRAHERMGGPATRCILQRAYEEFGQTEYAPLSGISVAHLYNLRHSECYPSQATLVEPTRPTVLSIGERRRPDPQGRPDYLRVDTVHQGDW